MDPVSLASAAVGFVVPLLRRIAGRVRDGAGEAVAGAVVPEVEAVLDLLRSRLRSGTYEGAVLTGVAEDPDAEDRRQALVGAVAAAVRNDPGFAAALRAAVDGAGAATGPDVVATDVGIVAGGDVNVWGTNVSNRDQTITTTYHAPPAGG